MHHNTILFLFQLVDRLGWFHLIEWKIVFQLIIILKVHSTSHFCHVLKLFINIECNKQINHLLKSRFEWMMSLILYVLLWVCVPLRDKDDRILRYWIHAPTLQAGDELFHIRFEKRKKKSMTTFWYRGPTQGLMINVCWEPRPPPPPPHSVLFRVRILCLFPPFESTPLSPDWKNFWTPLSRAFRRLFLPWRPP